MLYYVILWYSMLWYVFKYEKVRMNNAKFKALYYC